MTDYSSYEAVQELGDKPRGIRDKTATVLGLGALGSAAAELLVRAGINLRIIDKDRVYEQDLPLLSLYASEHVSKFKAKEAKKLLEAINPDVKIKAFHEELMKNNAYLIESDVIIDCSNSMSTALLANEARKKTPLVYARAAGVEGYVLTANDISIKDIQGFLEKHTPTSGERGVLNTTVKWTAALAVNKALKLLTGQRHEKNLLIINGWKFTVEKVPVRKDKR